MKVPDRRSGCAAGDYKLRNQVVDIFSDILYNLNDFFKKSDDEDSTLAKNFSASRVGVSRYQYFQPNIPSE